MRLSLSTLTFTYIASLLVLSCVDPLDLSVRGTVDVIVVDGTITNLAELQVIRLNRSRADRLTGRFGTLPITKATVEVVIDSLQVIACHETIDGSYQLPSDFRGQVGHAYQLRFALSDGTRYVSTPQIMPPVTRVEKIYAQFNLSSLSQPIDGYFRAGHDVFIDTQDPADQRNYYRWDWVLYEKQLYCKSCTQGVYAVNNIIPRQYRGGSYVSGDQPYEDCFKPVDYGDSQQPGINKELWVYDYFCRTQCWEIIRGTDLHLFDDQLSNGGVIFRRKVAQVPFYQRAPCVVDVRQSSLTKEAYLYYKLVQDQTQNTGGLADTPPAAPVGNVRNVVSNQENVVGYFTASAVSLAHQWLDRKDSEGIPFGATDPTGPHENAGDDLFYALNLRRPELEPSPPYTGARPSPKITIYGGPPRVPTAICAPSESRTPFKPEGWRD